MLYYKHRKAKTCFYNSPKYINHGDSLVILLLCHLTFPVNIEFLFLQKKTLSIQY